MNLFPFLLLILRDNMNFIICLISICISIIELSLTILIKWRCLPPYRLRIFSTMSLSILFSIILRYNSFINPYIWLYLLLTIVNTSLGPLMLRYRIRRSQSIWHHLLRIIPERFLLIRIPQRVMLTIRIYHILRFLILSYSVQIRSTHIWLPRWSLAHILLEGPPSSLLAWHKVLSCLIPARMSTRYSQELRLVLLQSSD